MLPYPMIKAAFKKVNAEKQPVNVYLHPWEFDPQQPRIKAGLMKTFRHYVNIAKNENKFRRLLQDFEFQPISDYLNKLENC